ncbi:unnamed protein product [Cuscuta campestris]|uniref:Uncharacterized protein n=1 Tax=Cuscuta campestris TaxID=132261 RepID=A0A484NMG8_9ASTE|nr:unnamed protein product [Cuscuta campestris]
MEKIATADRNSALSTEAPLAPVTMQRRVRTDLDESIPKPYVRGALPDRLQRCSLPANNSPHSRNHELPFSPQNIHKNKHGSDTGTYDAEGRYLPANFENIFSKYARTVPDKLTLAELWEMTQGNRNTFDFFGWVAAKLEWGFLYLLARDPDGFLSKEAIRRCYDGSLFEYCAKMKKGLERKTE